MRTHEKEKREKIQEILKRILFIVFILLFLTLLITILFFIPDLILFLRNFYINIFKIKTGIDSLTYVQMMINIIVCCITAILSYFTYRLTKILRSIETERHDAKLSTLAFRLEKNLKNNCWTIYNSCKNIMSISELQYLEDLDEICFTLLVAKELNNEDLELLMKYNEQISNIHKNKETPDKTKKMEVKFCNNFLNDNDPFEYNEQTQKLIDKLNRIMGRCEIDV